jgi:hypothetical protein
MTITKDIAAKFAVAIVAVSMVLSAFAPVAKAQTTEDLQKMINDLLAQVAALQSQAGQSGSSAAAGVCPYTWTRDLAVGATGADVMKLQQSLNADVDTRVAASGVGSVGMETEYFGPATAAAVSKFQVKYRADILSPANLVNPTGYFGASSRAKMNSICSSAPVVTPGDEDATDEDEDEDAEAGELSGEGSLDVFEIEDASDTDIPEGASDEVIAELTLEATDGDIEISRMDLALVGVNTPTEADPWEVFETISLWVDGDMVAEFDASDEDEYLDEDDGTLRFSGLDIVLMEDEEVEMVVAASVQNDVDDAGTDADWSVQVDEVRYFDADGVATDDDSTDELGDAVEFEIVEEGDGEELNFSLASSNPDATDIVVDTDSTTDGVTILEYTIEAEEADIELNTLFVKVITSTTSSLVIDDVTLEVDGQSFDAENSASSTADETTFEFDIDGDVVIDADEEVVVKVIVDLRAQESSNNVDRYSNGTTIMAEVTATERDLTDAEGADDISELSGSAVGEDHTLVAEGILVPVDGVETATDTSGENDTLGEFTIDFEVTAVEGDFYVYDLATIGTTATTGVEFTVDGAAGATTTGTLSSTADEDTDGVFTVREGETETFTLRVTVDAATSGDYRVTLGGVNYTEDTDGVNSTELYNTTPAQDFRTAYETIQAN